MPKILDHTLYPHPYPHPHQPTPTQSSLSLLAAAPLALPCPALPNDSALRVLDELWFSSACLDPRVQLAGHTDSRCPLGAALDRVKAVVFGRLPDPRARAAAIDLAVSSRLSYVLNMLQDHPHYPGELM